MAEKKNSRIKQFYKKTHQERLNLLKDFANLNDKEIYLLKNFKALDFNAANRMIENVVSTMPLPLGIATNFLINNKDYLIPMALEEPSVVAAASSAAKLARFSGGFSASSTQPIITGQIQIKKIKNISQAIKKIENNKKEIIDLANKQDSFLIELGGGVQDLQTRILNTTRGKMLIVHLIANVKDTMGANVVNTMAEKTAPTLEKLTGGKISLRIISNLPIHRIAKAKTTWTKDIIGTQVIEEILDAYAFAQADPFRCATHNKGIMNGIDAVAIATGNDFRALEAGAHSFAAFEKKYSPLTKYYKNNDGNLVGEIELPLAVGITGGITQSHPTAKICLKILGVKTSSELSQVMAAVGLAQNFAALKALVTTGIQASHMKLHSRNIAITAGATKNKIDLISQKMCRENNISISRAKELIKIYAEK